MTERPAPVFPWIGGKWAIAKWIVRHLPPHTTYVDHYGGAAGLLLRKSPSPVEVYNDIDGELVNVWRVVRDQREALAEALELTPWALQEWRECRRAVREVEPASDVERARRFITVARQSFSGAFGRAWKRSLAGEARGGVAREVSAWRGVPRAVRLAGERLQGVQIDNLSALECIVKYDSPDTLHYLDPPYVPGTRADKLYRHEADIAHHRELITLLTSGTVRGAVVLSGYPHPLYDDALRGWRRESFSVLCRAHNGHAPASLHKPRTEVLWIKDAQGAPEADTLWTPATDGAPA